MTFVNSDHPSTPAVVDLLRAAAHDAGHPLTQGLAIVALLRAGDHRSIADIDLAEPLAAASVEMVPCRGTSVSPRLFDRAGDAAPPDLRLRAAAILNYVQGRGCVRKGAGLGGGGQVGGPPRWAGIDLMVRGGSGPPYCSPETDSEA